jgi:hypothetical protein
MACLRSCVHETIEYVYQATHGNLTIYIWTSLKSDYTADQIAFSLHSWACCILRETTLKFFPYPCTNDTILRKNPTNALYYVYSGFGGLEVACWPLVPKLAGSNPAEAVGFFGRKIPQHAFLRMGSKAVCPMSCFTACKRIQKWCGSRHFRQNSLGRFSPIFPPSATGFASVASDAWGLLWRKLERSKSLVLFQVGGLTCRWQQHSVKPSCWECSTKVEQAETQLGL